MPKPGKGTACPGIQLAFKIERPLALYRSNVCMDTFALWSYGAAGVEPDSRRGSGDG